MSNHRPVSDLVRRHGFDAERVYVGIHQIPQGLIDKAMPLDLARGLEVVGHDND